jgi:hypothetical protein
VEIDKPLTSADTALFIEHVERYKRIPFPVAIPEGGLSQLSPADIAQNHKFLLATWNDLVKGDEAYASFIRDRWKGNTFPELGPLPGETVDRSRAASEAKQGESKPQDARRCFICKQPGHLKSDCPLKAQGGTNKPNQHRGKRGGRADTEAYKAIGIACAAAIFTSRRG